MNIAKITVQWRHVPPIGQQSALAGQNAVEVGLTMANGTTVRIEMQPATADELKKMIDSALVDLSNSSFYQKGKGSYSSDTTNSQMNLTATVL